MVVFRDLYGLKSAGGSFGEHFPDCMKNMEYMSCPADPDLLIKPMAIPIDRVEYYSYIILCVDYILCIHHDADSVFYKI